MRDLAVNMRILLALGAMSAGCGRTVLLPSASSAAAGGAGDKIGSFAGHGAGGKAGSGGGTGGAPRSGGMPSSDGGQGGASARPDASAEGRIPDAGSAPEARDQLDLRADSTLETRPESPLDAGKESEVDVPADLRFDSGGADARVPALELVAGGLGGIGNLDGIGAAARFWGPTGLAFDGTGNLFVADEGNHTIRRVVIATGAVTTLAGLPGVSGSTDGVGASARFNGPGGLASDELGNLFVSDTSNHTIRKIVIATGVVSTLAGLPDNRDSVDGVGPSARFSEPQGIATDGAGNLFIADCQNDTIRKLVIATGAVTTIAGSAGNPGADDGIGTAARFNYPFGVAIDRTGNLFVADCGNDTIRKVIIATGAVTTIAGLVLDSGSDDGVGTAARFSYPSGLVLDEDSNLVVADLDNRTLRKIVLATGAVTTLAGVAGKPGSQDGTGAAARFGYPMYLASDGAGNVFVTDPEASTIRKIALATNTVTTLAGRANGSWRADGTGASAAFAYPNGVEVDDTGNLFVAAADNGSIRKIVASTGLVTTLAGSQDGPGSVAEFYSPCGVTFDGNGNLYVADSGGNLITKILIATGYVTTLAGSANQSGDNDGVGASARFNRPHDLAYDGAGSLFIADRDNQTIRKLVIATQEVTTIAGSSRHSGRADGTGANARFLQPEGVAVDGAGNLFVADAGNFTIRKISIATAAVTTLAGSSGNPGSADGTGAAAQFGDPAGLGCDRAGHLFVADRGNGTIRKVSTATGSVTTVVGIPGRKGVMLGPLPAGLNSPTDVAVGPSGELYILDEHSVLVARL